MSIYCLFIVFKIDMFDSAPILNHYQVLLLVDSNILLKSYSDVPMGQPI